MGHRPVPVKEDKRTAICSDPNNSDDHECIVRFSVETVNIVRNLPNRYAPEPRSSIPPPLTPRPSSPTIPASRPRGAGEQGAQKHSTKT